VDGSGHVLARPVVAVTICGLSGSMTMALTATSKGSGFTICQVLPPSCERMIPSAVRGVHQS
jgi:hypothetical protein